jgi:hypothetical protein
VPQAAPGPGAAQQLPVTLSGRSIYYGISVYLAYLAGSVWIVAFAQSLLAAVSVYLTIGLIGRASDRRIRTRHALLIGTVAALATPLGYTSNNLMPGIFTGLGLLAEANLLFLWNWQSRAEKAFWIVVLAYALLVHSTNILLGVALLILSIGYAAWRRLGVKLAPLASVGVCIMVGLLGQFAFAEAVKVSTGAAPVRPPFVAMRLIADGPGYAYLQEHCSTERYLYCRVLQQRNPNSDELLWSEDPHISLFRGLGPTEQRVSASQQRKFLAAVVAEKPLQVISLAAKNSAVQLFSIDLLNFNYSDGNRERYEETVPPYLLESMKRTRAYTASMPTAFVEWSTALLAGLSSMFLAAFQYAGSANETARKMRAYGLCILAAIAINAVICGALSGPKGRYETRIIWVLPIVAGSLAFGSSTSLRDLLRRNRNRTCSSSVVGGDGLEPPTLSV